MCCTIFKKSCDCFCEFWRSLPFSAGLVFVIAHVGVFMAIGARNKVKELVDAFEGDELVHSLDLMFLPFSIVFITDIVALVLSFLASGKTRECIFGATHSNKNCRRCLCCLKCLMGPCAMRLIMFAVAVTFALQLVFSYIFMVLFCVVEAVKYICKGGHDIINKAQELIDLMKVTNSMKPPAVLGHTTLVQYCHDFGGMGNSVLVLFIAAVITTVSQGFMLAVLAAESEKIKYEISRSSSLVCEFDANIIPATS